MRDPQFMARVQRVQEAASGRWLDILIDAGLPEVMLLRLNRPCPLCGGRDRFWTTGRSSMTEIERISDGPRCSRSSPTTRDGSSRCTGPI